MIVPAAREGPLLRGLVSRFSLIAEAAIMQSLLVRFGAHKPIVADEQSPVHILGGRFSG